MSDVSKQLLRHLLKGVDDFSGLSTEEQAIFNGEPEAFSAFRRGLFSAPWPGVDRRDLQTVGVALVKSSVLPGSKNPAAPLVRGTDSSTQAIRHNGYPVYTSEPTGHVAWDPVRHEWRHVRLSPSYTVTFID